MSAAALRTLAEIFRLMGDASRLSIILACLDRPICVSDIAAETKLSPSLVSHHLRLLRGARVLTALRQGRQVFYAAADDHVRQVIRDMAAHVAEPKTERTRQRRGKAPHRLKR
ncbi:MAG: helix-turn-helix transcriptional regulator [Proteobacteria bacterium]|nr:helix-turn-helix transcriptional regulator [Pseudomonadota bacterium]MBI3499799.1 helix-turn-helix transcriptional regulator [Pseudomonadota bacterium]